MTVAKILGALLMTLILGMSFGAINTADAKKDTGTPGRYTTRCPGPAHWRLPSHLSTTYQKSGSSCIKKGEKKLRALGGYLLCKAEKMCQSKTTKDSAIACAYVEGWKVGKKVFVPHAPNTCKE